jgi:hypothetical protein
MDREHALLSVSGPKSPEYEAEAVNAWPARRPGGGWESNIIIDLPEVGREGLDQYRIHCRRAVNTNRGFLEQLSDYQLIKNDTTPWC